MIVIIPSAQNKPEIISTGEGLIIAQKIEILANFVSELEGGQQESPGEYDELVTEHFWELS